MESREEANRRLAEAQAVNAAAEAEPFDVLDALSRARTALDDPEAIDLAGSGSLYAIDRIDEVIGALYFEPSNDARDETVWVLTHLGRLLAQVADALPDRDLSPATFDAAAALVTEAGDRIDEAIDTLRGDTPQ